MPLDTTQAQSHGRVAQMATNPTVDQIAADEPRNVYQSKPNDAHTVEAILKSMGVDEFDPRVTHQLLELLYRHVSNILLEARQYSEHADKQAIDADDVRLAINSRNFSAFAQPPPRQVIAQLANERNAIPLPPIHDRQGIQLPKPALQLARRNYMISKMNKRHRNPIEDARRRSPIRRRPTSGSVITIDGDSPEKKLASPRPPIYARQPMDVVNVDYPSTPSRPPNPPPSANLPTNLPSPAAPTPSAASPTPAAAPPTSSPAAPTPITAPVPSAAPTVAQATSASTPPSSTQQPAQNMPRASAGAPPQPPPS